MRTTLDLDEDLYRQLKAAAALKGETVRTVVTRAIQRELARQSSAPMAIREPSPRPWIGSLSHYGDRVQTHDWDVIREAIDEARSRGVR